MDNPVVLCVIALNVVIALMGFYLAWRIWQVKQVLSVTVRNLTVWERSTHRVLNPEVTPQNILMGRSGIAALRSHYAQLQQQIEQLQRILGVVLVGLRLLQPKRRRRRRSLRL